MKEHEQELLLISQRNGTNKMIGLDLKKFRSITSPFGKTLIYNEENFVISFPKGMKFGKWESELLYIVIGKFIEQLGTLKPTDEDIKNSRSMIVTNDEIAEIYQANTRSKRDELIKNMRKALENLKYTRFKVEDEGRKQHKTYKYNDMGIIGAHNDKYTRGIDINLDLDFANYIAWGHIMYFPKDIFKLPGKYGFYIAYTIYVHQRKNYEDGKNKRNGVIGIDTIINQIPELTKCAKKDKKRAYDQINNTLINMKEYGLLKGYEYRNNKISEESNYDYNDNIKLLEGDMIEYTMPKFIADTYKDRRRKKKRK